MKLFLPTAGKKFRKRPGDRRKDAVYTGQLRNTGHGIRRQSVFKGSDRRDPDCAFRYKTSGIRGAELLLDVIERGEKIPVEMKLGFRMVNGQEEEDAS